MTKITDLTGQKFGTLTVLSLVENTHPPKWHCICECGNEIDVTKSNLERQKSCGCLRKKDLTGQKFGKLTALRIVKKDVFGNYFWLCSCDCGREKVIQGESLSIGATKSCGCIKMKDLVGQKFNRFTVLKRAESDKRGRSRWFCKCDCGTEKIVNENALLTGSIKSCGCLKAEIGRKNGSLCTLPNGGSSFNSLYSRYKSGAETRNLTFLLTKDDFKELIKQKCFYCDREPQQIFGDKHRVFSISTVYNGIDRVDNSRGYELDNCVPCCGRCNTEKRSVSIAMCKKIMEFINRKEENNG